MTIRGHILVVDNVPSNLEAMTPLIEGWGYQVFAASSAKEAKRILTQHHIDLAIIDVRLSDENDHSDRSGITLAEHIDENIDHNIAKILITAHERFELREKWLSRTDIHLKQSPFSELREKIEEPFRKYIRYNHNLTIRYARRLTPATLIQPLRKDGIQEHWKDTNAFLQSFEHLMRKLFFRESRIELNLLDVGRSGAGVVLVKRFYQQKLGASVVVKYGYKPAVEKEYESYYDYVEPYLIMHSTHLIGRLEASHQLAGMKLMFVGSGHKQHDRVYDFAKAFQSPRIFDNTSLERCIRHLFKETCALWYHGKQKWHKRPRFSVTRGMRDLANCYESWLKLDRKAKQQQIRDLIDGMHNKQVQSVHLQVTEQSITFTHGAGEVEILPNPYYVWQNQRSSLPKRSAYTCITHGDLQARNLLVDQNEHTWLIDFQRTGIGPGLRDAAELESAIKFDLLDSIDLPSLIQFEREALNCNDLNHRIALHTLPRMRAKQYRLFERAKITIDAIRHEASSALEHPPMEEYLTGLFFYALKMLTLNAAPTELSADFKAQRKDAVQYHILYSAAFICHILLKRESRR